MEFHEKTKHLGHCYGRDLAMKLGDDVFTPDAYFLSNEHLVRQGEYYLDGPADIVIEILLSEFEAADRNLKFGKYEKAVAPEYWLLDPLKKSFEAYRLYDGLYHSIFSGIEGFYRTPILPGIKLDVANLWCGYSYDSAPCVIVEGEVSEPIKRPRHADDLYWGSLPFVPRIGLEPTAISFEEFIAWAPESKFELFDGMLVIAGEEGTRNVLGMALMTFGLLQTIPLLPAEMWVESIVALSDPVRDGKRKADMFELARKAAAVLREKHRVRRVAVTGDLLKDAPWNGFSLVELAVWDDPGDDYEVWTSLTDIFGKTRFLIHAPSDTSIKKYSEIEQTALDI